MSALVAGLVSHSTFHRHPQAHHFLSFYLFRNVRLPRLRTRRLWITLENAPIVPMAIFLALLKSAKGLEVVRVRFGKLCNTGSSILADRVPTQRKTYERRARSSQNLP